VDTGHDRGHENMKFPWEQPFVISCFRGWPERRQQRHTPPMPAAVFEQGAYGI